MAALSQFIRAETYPLHRSKLTGKGRGKRARGWDARNIRNEQERRPEAIPHIHDPKPPVLLFGVSPSKVLERIAIEVKSRKAQLRGAKAKEGRIRRIRRDQHVKIDGVVSYPVDWSGVRQIQTNLATYESWKKEVVEFLRDHFAKCGGELVTVVEHVDESYPHLHFTVLPTGSPTFAAREVHDGWRLKLKARALGVTKKEENAAYTKGAENLQDAFYLQVSQKFGHLRRTVKRPRVNRHIYLEEKRQLDRENKLLAMARRVADVEKDQLAKKAGSLEARLRDADTKLAAIDRREAELAQRETKLVTALTQLVASKQQVAEKCRKAAVAEEAYRAAAADIVPHVDHALSNIKDSISELAKLRDRFRQSRTPAEALSFSVARTTVESLERVSLVLDRFICVKSSAPEDDVSLEVDNTPTSDASEENLG